ncbi:hypothetical protein SCHPADRAFT_905576 [Schizopora paradoxa]|uniref:Uncharacterized protein n=1 Tax=Schizopora paradoxa TaxID=27342 RepID=A0A0H2RIW9_9AGAM|nr:hypothetical protein SCHPADRAFT_905576 [Schizopora paradoxa]
MFSTDSKERQAHHLFMSLNSDQYKEFRNHELLGKAAAYHAAVEFTDHVQCFGLPQTQVMAQNLIIDKARSFICCYINSKGLALETGKAMDYALKSLYKTIHNPNPVAWRITHTTPRNALQGWSAGDEDLYKGYERWTGDAYDYGDFGPTKGIRSRLIKTSTKLAGGDRFSYSKNYNSFPPPPPTPPLPLLRKNLVDAPAKKGNNAFLSSLCCRPPRV